MPRAGLGMPKRLKWEVGAGAEPKDRPFDTVSEAVSSAEKKKQSLTPPFSSTGKKIFFKGWGWGGARKPWSRAVS